MSSRRSPGTRLQRLAAIVAVLFTPAIGWLLAVQAAAAVGGLGSPAAAIADILVAAAAVAGAATSLVLTATTLAMTVAPVHSRARRLAERASPAAWRRVVAIAVSGSALTGLAIPAASAPLPTDGSESTPAPIDAGWVAPRSAQAPDAGWVQPSVDAAPPRQAAADPPAESDGSGPRDEDQASAPRPPEDRGVHRVEPGESLWSITARVTGGTDAEVTAAWPELYSINRSSIGDDPALIHPGDELTLPAGWRR
ncbi:LysM peptidoglycan-binding domain-containing protein [Demequina activiva]|uniref:LysM domain-containing protein n=1 Tax=Demequina activiva TaxID=1582364 RepID=A0A919UM74_9MICO|nr:LysM domain-containing protein [Demequina activiva]GIG55408.1 hypothetical protein Dac01nite_21600 [Demequina activiva]